MCYVLFICFYIKKVVYYIHRSGRAPGRETLKNGGCMRQQFIEMPDATYSAKDLKKAHEIAPWAAKIVKVGGGYIAFASISDYDMWRKQR